MRKFVLKILGMGLLLGGLYYTASALIIPAKAYLSVHLIDAAWVRTLQGDDEARPWPWMDSVPVAKIEIPSLNRSHIVLSGVSGSTLAFAPGWHEGSDAPGEKGVSIISAHKDTHFSYLDELKTGDEIFLTTADGRFKLYEVKDFRILSAPEIDVQRDKDKGLLVLSTCYPFNNWDIGGQMRYVVIARQVEPKASMRYAGL